MADELAGQTGAERAMSLLRVTQRHANDFWRIGPGSPAARPHLDAALSAIEESYDLFGPRDAMRGQSGVMFGVLLAWKQLLGGAAEAERDRAIGLLTQSLGYPGLPVFQLATGRMMLGELYLGRGKNADLDHAAECFRAVLKESMNAEMTNTATTLLKYTEMLRGVGGLGPGLGLGLGRLGLGLGRMVGFGLNLGAAPGGQTTMDPLDRPVPVVHGPEPEETFVPPERPTLSIDVTALRRRLDELVGTDGGTYSALISLLRSQATPAWTDEFVSLATRVVSSADPVRGTDHLLLAAALLLRSRRDGASGWDAADQDDETDSDLEAAAASLLTAAGSVPADQPVAMTPLLQLATLLPQGTLDRLTDPLANLAVATRELGAGALLFGPPAAALPWLDAQTCRLTAADVPCEARHVVVLDDGAADLGVDQAVTCLASTAQLLDLSRKKPRSSTEKVVLLVHPRGGRESATADTLLLRRSFHVLELAETGRLAPGALRGVDGALVILPPGVFLPLADRLLDAGSTGVIGWRRAVPDRTATLMLFVLHTELADTGRSPAAAVRAVRDWVRHPDIDGLPLQLAGHAAKRELLREEDWSSLVYRGR